MTVGRYLRALCRAREVGEEQAAEAELRRAVETQDARLAERTRIARDRHDASEPFPWALVPVLLAVRTIVGGPLTVEFGWRGFLVPVLCKRHGAIAVCVLTTAAARYGWR